MDESPNLMNFIVLNCNINPSVNPKINIDIIIIFSYIDNINNCSGDSIQVNHDPEVIPNDLNIRIGIKKLMEEWFWEVGLDLMFDLLDNRDIRIEYEAVIPIDMIIKINIVRFKCDDNIFSKITSLEKNPDMKGIPIKASLFIPSSDKIMGKFR